MTTARDVLPILFENARGLVELRALPSKAQCFAPVTDVAALRAFCLEHPRENLYFGVAARQDATSGAAENCTTLGALFTDQDFKNRGEPHARARLAACPLPPSLVVASGGGLHSYWLLREPLEVPREDPKAWLRRLATYLDADLAAAEPARILRLPGTLNHKYEPPRRVQVEAWAPERRYTLSDFDAWLPTKSASAAADSARAPEPFVLPKTITAGQRNAMLFKLARSFKAKGLTQTGIWAAVVAANETQCEPPLPHAELRALVDGALARPDRPRLTAHVASGTAPASSPVSPVVIRLDTVRPERVEWLWPLRLARGKLTVLAGDPGLGKSYVSLDVAARVSRGAAWADDSGRAPLGDVLLLTAEDGLADTVRPRLDRLGGDPARVHVLAAIRDGGEERSFSLDRDLSRLAAALDQTGAVLCIIDPLSAYLGTADAYKDADVRALLAPLARLAETRRIAVLVVMHLRKNREGHALQRLSGSIAFGAAARIVLALGKDEDDPERRLLAGVKSNVGRLAPALAFRIVGDEDAGVLQWDPGQVDGIDGERLLTAGPADRDEHDAVVGLLEAVLPEEGTDVPVQEIERAARANGLTMNQLNKRKRRLGIESRHIGFGRQGAWYWRRLPQTATDPAKIAPGSESAIYEGSPEKPSGESGADPKIANPGEVAVYEDGPAIYGAKPEPAPAPEAVPLPLGTDVQSREF